MTLNNERRFVRENLFNTYGEQRYRDVLVRIQSDIAKKLVKKVAQYEEQELSDKIYEYIVQNNIKCDLTDDPRELARHIYHDMAGYSFITREGLLDLAGFEELNVNAWNNIHIKINGKSTRTSYSFVSPEQAIDIHKKMLQVKNVTLDNASPRAIADIGDNVRICCSIVPIVDKDVAVASSIRKVSLSTVDLPKLLQTNTMTKDMMDFLILCLRHGASICVSGETGSGKTTTLGSILSVVAKNVRMVTIEEGSREWDFIQRDDKGNPINDVIHKLTRPNIENVQYHYDQEFLIKDALREDPDVIGMGEIRGREAFEIMGAANTGHIVATTVHSNGAQDTPERVVTLAKKAFDMEDSTLYSMFVRAFPILVHQEKLPDNSRKVTQIYEVVGYKNGIMEYNPIFEFEVMENIYNDKDEVIRVEGAFMHLNSITKAMRQRLLKRGAKTEDLNRYYYEETQKEVYA